MAVGYKAPEKNRMDETPNQQPSPDEGNDPALCRLSEFLVHDVEQGNPLGTGMLHKGNKMQAHHIYLWL